MDKVFLYNQRQEKFETEVVRYFVNNGKKYFIFSLNEKDANGYVQLYASRIENENGKLAMKNITDANEWNDFKSEIQTIVGNNRSGRKNEIDLDYKELNNMVVTEFRIFKLKENVARELGENKCLKDTNPQKNPQTLEAASAQSNDLTIEEILKQVSEGARNAKEVSSVIINTAAPVATPVVAPAVEPHVNSSVEPVLSSFTPNYINKEENVEPKNIKDDNTMSDFAQFTSNYKNETPVAVEQPVVPTEIKTEQPMPTVIKSEHSIPSIFTKLEQPVVPTEIKAEQPLSPVYAKKEEMPTVDYKAKYENTLSQLKKMEKENMRLINELVDAKAKIETIKDILG